MPDGQIFKATYSGIPVYEMMCKGVAIMRRRSDSWLNATQILKVAGFDKPQRTRILEREVQKGEHEKVQGGYGKYQGTWIPLSRGMQLCQQYHCEHLLRPIIDFHPDASDVSPPLAPKHLVAAPSITKIGASRKAESGTPTMSTRSAKKVVSDVGDHSDVETLSAKGSADGTMTPSPSEVSSSSRTPSPIRSSSSPRLRMSALEDPYRPSSPLNNRKRKHRHDDLDVDADGMSDRLNGRLEDISYGDQILEYFISDTPQIPQVLISPPADFDPNQAIDDDGHTALHWASAMGRIRVVKLLLTAGADIFKVNKAGQTALMRSVMFANNYDVRKFPELYELLHRSTLNIDNSNRTVFHHIVDVAMSKQKSHAARYYMETVLTRLSDYPRELADIVNFQDEDGETALTLAARCRSKRLVKILIDHGANPKIANKDGKSTEDYILEDERFRSSPIIQSRTMAMSFRNAQATNPPAAPSAAPYAFPPTTSDIPALHYSATGQKAATRCVNSIAALLDSLATSYDQELKDKERDMAQASALFTNIQAEILESRRTVNSLRSQCQGLEEAKRRQIELENDLRVKLGKLHRLGWEKWLKDEEERERAIRDASGGQLPSSSLENGIHRAANGEDITDLIDLHANIPTDPTAIRQQCDELRSEVAAHKKRRLDDFAGLVKAQAEAGTGGRMSEYRRLIGAGCGGVSPGEVDNVVTMLLETLESEDSSALAAWSGVPVNKPSTLSSV
ncbi:apses-domain-containing protein [Cytidiella melzeri]|nr:apses-domain-containing protein [Cytidiella melzeri]